jgi:hypothetical protein
MYIFHYKDFENGIASDWQVFKKSDSVQDYLF